MNKWVLLGLLWLGACCQACPSIAVGLVQVDQDLWLRAARLDDAQGWTEPTLVWVNARTVWVVDPGPHRCAGQALLREVQRRWPARSHQLINTHAHPRNVLANAAWPAGTPIHALAPVRTQMRQRCPHCLQRLRGELGAQVMQGTRIVLPNRLLRPGQWLALGQGRWQVLAHAPAHTEADLSLWNARTGQWFGGSLLAWSGVPDASRADLAAWRLALDTSPAMRDGVRLVGAPDDACAQQALRGTRAYLEALHVQLGAAFAQGQALHDWFGWHDPVPPEGRTPGQLRQHQINVQRVWRSLEEAHWSAPQR